MNYFKVNYKQTVIYFGAWVGKKTNTNQRNNRLASKDYV